MWNECSSVFGRYVNFLICIWQEFVVLKEEGQSLMHAAYMWGDKTMNTSSAEGRDLIAEELQALQHDWDNLISNISNTRSTLETCLLRWSDFDDSSEQILRWLKDMERRLKDNEPKADLSEKKSKLQRIKVNNMQYIRLPTYNTLQYSMAYCFECLLRVDLKNNRGQLIEL